LAVRGDKEIWPAIVVVIAHRDAHAEGAARHSRLLRDVGKSSITVVLVECIAQRFGRVVEIGRAAIDQIEIHPAVVVVVQKRDTGTERLREEVLLRYGVLVDPSDAALRRRHLYEYGW